MSYGHWRHGLCQCRQGCQCEAQAGPAAYHVTRGGLAMRVCTYCILSSDTNRELLVTWEDNPDTLGRYDAPGTILIANELHDRGGKLMPSKAGLN